jgi:succinyl-diaminopimelate desuccinylase
LLTQRISEQVETLKPEMVNTLMQLICVPAVGPENGGEGELQKAEKLMEILEQIGFDKIEHYDAPDPRVPSGKRPNIVAICSGETSQKLWIVTHLDVVPSGEETLWKITKPFEPLAKDDRVYGRGSEDNGQSLVASVYAVKALRLLGLKPKRTVALAFVADEEMGSTMGIQHLISQGIFQKGDLVLVPDSGNPEGSFIEIAEKSILWFRVRTFGKQTHGSLPNKGLNANRVGMQTALAMDSLLHAKYNAVNGYFDLPTSTFEPTRKDKNVDAVNIVPGEDVVYFDCRVLPNYSLDEVVADIERVLVEQERATEAKIELQILQKQSAPALIDGDSEMVALLKKALMEARRLEAKVGGIGGGTCAAFFRKIGIPAVVWSTVDEVAHQPDEYANIQSMVDDAKVFALLAVI